MQTTRCKDGYPTMSKYICYKKSSKTKSKWETYTKFPSQTSECGNAYGTGAITQKWNLGTLLTKITQSIGDPKELGTATSSSNVLGFCGGLGYTGLLARGPRHQR